VENSAIFIPTGVVDITAQDILSVSMDDLSDLLVRLTQTDVVEVGLTDVAFRGQLLGTVLIATVDSLVPLRTLADCSPARSVTSQALLRTLQSQIAARETTSLVADRTIDLITASESLV
jgi:hypothetical protein